MMNEHRDSRESRDSLDVINNAIINNSTPSLKNTVPNMVGMGLKDALYTLENAGLKTIITGKGKVASQSLSAGTLFKKGQTITLLLN